MNKAEIKLLLAILAAYFVAMWLIAPDVPDLITAHKAEVVKERSQ